MAGNIVITPGRDGAANPKITFTANNATPTSAITLEVLPSGEIAFKGALGNVLFTITEETSAVFKIRDSNANVVLGIANDGTVKIGPEEALVVDGSTIKYKGKSLAIESRFSPATLTYGASMALDFDGGGEQVVVLNGNVTFTTANRAAGKELSLLIQPGASARTVTWSEAWHPLGTALPTTIPANKWARLSLKCYGTAATDILAGISIEA